MSEEACCKFFNGDSKGDVGSFLALFPTAVRISKAFAKEQRIFDGWNGWIPKLWRKGRTNAFA